MELKWYQLCVCFWVGLYHSSDWTLQSFEPVWMLQSTGKTLLPTLEHLKFTLDRRWTQVPPHIIESSLSNAHVNTHTPCVSSSYTDQSLFKHRISRNLFLSALKCVGMEAFPECKCTVFYTRHSHTPKLSSHCRSHHTSVCVCSSLFKLHAPLKKTHNKVIESSYILLSWLVPLVMMIYEV